MVWYGMVCISSVRRVKNFFVWSFRVFRSCGMAGRWDKALGVLDQVEARKGAAALSTTMCNFAMIAVSERASTSSTKKTPPPLFLVQYQHCIRLQSRLGTDYSELNGLLLAVLKHLTCLAEVFWGPCQNRSHYTRFKSTWSDQT